MRVALEAGASRVELCQALGLGGLTPSAGSIALAVEAAAAASAPDFVHVLVRPRGGGFVYDADELATIVRDIRLARSLGAHGVVVGALTEDGALDLASIADFVEAADGMQVTVHRAVDAAADPLAAVASLADSGVRRVLTSGGAADCRAGLDVLGRMVAEVRGALEVMAGGGVRIDDIATLARGRRRRGAPVGAWPRDARGSERSRRRRDRLRRDGCRDRARRGRPPPARHDDDRGPRATRGGAPRRPTASADHHLRAGAQLVGTSITAGTVAAARRLAARHRRSRAAVRRRGIPLRTLPAASRCGGGRRRGRRRARRVPCARRGSAGGAPRRAGRRRAALDPGAARAPRRARRRDARRLVAVGGCRGARRRLRPLAAAAASARRLAARARAPALRARTRAGIARPPAAALRGVLVEPPRRRAGARPARLRRRARHRGSARSRRALRVAGSVPDSHGRGAHLVGHGAPQRVDRGRDARRGRAVGTARP